MEGSASRLADCGMKGTGSPSARPVPLRLSSKEKIARSVVLVICKALDAIPVPDMRGPGLVR